MKIFDLRRRIPVAEFVANRKFEQLSHRLDHAVRGFATAAASWRTPVESGPKPTFVPGADAAPRRLETGHSSIVRHFRGVKVF
ncbi:hypothetical protein JMJ94_02335 [Rhodovulum visakhapatnamense]|nr:hypothetical protein [Rhodovulum visakhapatnamense]